MNLSSKAILLLSHIALSPLLVRSSSAIVTVDKEKTNNNLLRGSLVEGILPSKTGENGVGIEYSHDGPMMDVSVKEPRLLLSSNYYQNEDISIYDGVWGDWTNMAKMHSGGFYACGAELRFEGRQGGGDDTAANGLKLTYCGLKHWYIQELQEVSGGNWGSWTGKKMCPEEKYIGAASVRFEDPIDGDDTALNGLKIYCVDKYWSNGEIIMVFNGNWGSWKSWGYKQRKLVKGAKVRFEASQGRGDDTALNGIQFNVERPNYSVSRQNITGRWILLTSGHQGQFTYKVTSSMSSTNGVEVTKEEVAGFEASISAGYSMISGSVSASQSFRTATAVSKSLKQSKTIEIEQACPTTGSPSKLYFMWQFVMAQPKDSNGAGFEIESPHYRCTSKATEQPRCPLGSCKDEFCQECY